MKYFDNNGAIVEDNRFDNGEAYTFAEHGMIEYVNRGHIVRIFANFDEGDERVLYSVEINEIDNEGPVYTSQREAREVATWRSKNGRIEF